MATWCRLSSAPAPAVVRSQATVTPVIVVSEEIQKGLEADRPEPSGSGRLYYATDTGKLYYDDGTGG